MGRIGRDTVWMTHSPAICATGSVVGKKEGEGPLHSYFDQIFPDTTMQAESWEKAESRLQTEAVRIALKKRALRPEQVDYILAGDLLNQCIGSAMGLRALNIPMIGLYGACSTMALGLAVGAMLADGGMADRVMAVTSSHFCAAERQFRFPLEYGSLRPPTAQWTVTGAGAALIGHDAHAPSIRAVTIGRITDLQVHDTNNMGAAMAPAAASTLSAYFRDTGADPSDFDRIITGDLGAVGSELLIELLNREGISIASRHSDCGLMIYDRVNQEVDAGGSGCGCAGSVFCGYVMHQLRTRAWKRILFMATGALMSTTSAQQGESIPGIAHLIHLESASSTDGEAGSEPTERKAGL